MPPSFSIGLLTAFWAALFVAMLKLRIWNREVGEYCCTYVMITGLIIVYGFGFHPCRCCSLWRWRRNDSDSINDDSATEENDSDSNPEDNPTVNEHDIEVTTTMRPDTPEVSLQTISDSHQNCRNSSRMHFLDNCKIFLTATVVTHHVGCAFGGAGEDDWYLFVGDNGPPLFQKFVRSLTLLNQCYFMPFFFFISAYFCVPSYNSAGSWEKFRIRKRNRLLFGALLETFAISPLTMYVAGYRGPYIPSAGVAWYLYWLLLFQLVYASFRWVRSTTTESTSIISTPSINAAINEESRLNERFLDEDVDIDDAVLATTTTSSEAFPSTKLRIACGICVCGFLVLPFLVLLLGSFASMPVSFGSMTADFFLFYLGLRAYDQKWFENGLLSDKLDTSPKFLVAMVAAECFGLVAISLETDNGIQSVWVGLLFVAMAGMICLDMSLLVLMVFQTFGNYETPLTVFLARSAYGVYLIHPLVVTGTTALFVRLCGETGVTGYLYPIGFLVVNLVSHFVSWPLAYFLAHLPYLRKIL